MFDIFIKAPTIVALWQGGMVDHEISKHLTLTQYSLTLADKNRAELTMTEHETWTGVGTYSVKGDRLKLSLQDEDGVSSEREFKFVLARATLELYDPASGKILVQLLRQRQPPVIRMKVPPKVKDDEPEPKIKAGEPEPKGSADEPDDE